LADEAVIAALVQIIVYYIERHVEVKDLSLEVFLA
jgi:hypothetical protein